MCIPNKVVKTNSNQKKNKKQKTKKKHSLGQIDFFFFFGNKKNQSGNKGYLSKQKEAICHQDR